MTDANHFGSRVEPPKSMGQPQPANPGDVAPTVPEIHREGSTQPLVPPSMIPRITHPDMAAAPAPSPITPQPAASASQSSQTVPQASDPVESNPEVSQTIAALVRFADSKGASDIHIRVGDRPRFRIRGAITLSQDWPSVTPTIFAQFLQEILTPEQLIKFKRDQELDTAIFYPGFLRCRINCFDSLTGGAIVMRLIPLDVPTVDGLGLPPVLKKLVTRSQGLILVTGPTGAGKSTSIATMIRHLNEVAHRHIVTIEDPIEYVHTSMKCLVSQREVGLHTQDFSHAVRSVLREDPDVIVIGEMRDRETVEIALKASQTGHLVLGTLHTNSAIGSINRLLNLYHPDEQPTMRMQIVESLIAVVAQQLLPTTDGQRTAAHEILINTPAMADYLLKNEELEAFHLMEIDTSEGMQVMNQALCELLMLGRISPDDAVKCSLDPGDLRRRVRNDGFDPGRSAMRDTFDGTNTRNYRPA